MYRTASESLNCCIFLSDLNECQEGDGPCTNGICENQPGSFRCVCTKPGTSLDTTQTMCIGKLI